VHGDGKVPFLKERRLFGRPDFVPVQNQARQGTAYSRDRNWANTKKTWVRSECVITWGLRAIILIRTAEKPSARKKGKTIKQSLCPKEALKQSEATCQGA